MDENVSPMWHQNHESGLGNADLTDDFSSFLNFGDMPLGLTSPFDTDGQNGSPLAMDTDFCLDGNDSHSTSAGTNGMQAVTQAEMMDMQFHELQKSLEAQMMSHQHQHRMHRHRQHHDGMIPPTPSSMEMHAGVPQATLHNNIHPQMMMDRYSMYREEPMIFTPLVSPAVTPLETEFSRHLPDFVMPGAFSPLTSPALDAHHHRSHMPNPHMSHNSMPMQVPIDPPRSPVMGKKGNNGSGSGSGSARRKSVTSRTPARVVRESPSMKPQRKRAPPPIAVTPKLSNALSQQAQGYPLPPPTPRSSRRDSMTPVSQQSTPMQRPQSRSESSNESVSPEPLPEVLMAPPPPPPPRLPSSRDDISDSRKGFNAPVTPASLMRLPPTNVRSDDTPPISMDTSVYLNRDVEITDASRASMREPENTEEMPTPTMNNAPSSKTPSLTPSLRPSAARTTRHISPLDPHNAGAIAKKDSLRLGRKRSSISSSPALQPRISPNIKPLLPQGMSPDASAFLLASKSNYQNIVEGNHSHLGLQYPEHLSTNLTSKRTSHKIAEQGRRNRINNALAEMASLLPLSGPGGGGSGGSGSGGEATGKEQTSKASTVELAIDYIRQLKQELERTKGRLKEVEAELGIGCGGSSDAQEGDKEKSVERSPVQSPKGCESRVGSSPAAVTTA